jgi:putative endonuclease
METSNTTIAHCYILFSKKINKYYIGITTELPELRLMKHNESSYGKHFTSISNDWILVQSIAFESLNLARKAELYIKRMKSRVFIEKLINQKEELDIFIKKIMSI